MNIKSVSTVDLAEKFLEYCKKYPEERFWQAIRNFTGNDFVYIGNGYPGDPGFKTDTFYIENDKAARPQ